MPNKSRQKSGYQVTNWSAYNKSLVNRGNITFWFSEEVLANWEHENKGFKVGRPFVYSDTAIEVLLTLRELFQLPYRQTEGFGRALVKLMGAEVAIPTAWTTTMQAGRFNGYADVMIGIMAAVITAVVTASMAALVASAARI